MGMRSGCSPFGSEALMVDRLIGDAYDVVKKLYDNMDMLYLIAGSIGDTTIGEPMLKARMVTLDGQTGAANATVTIPFNDPDVDYTKVVSSSVRIEGTDGNLYFADSGYFTAFVTEDGLSLKLTNSAPAEVQFTVAQWFYVYKADG